MQHIWEARSLPKDIAAIGCYCFHAPILFECAIIAFRNAPNNGKVKILQQVPWPLLAQGSFRTLQDAKCFMDLRVTTSALKLIGIYKARLDKEIKKTCVF